jgi:alcohol dehydrogenase
MFCANAVGTSVQIGGGHAEYMLAHADATMLLPDSLAYEQAAPIFCAGYTVWSGLRWAAPQPGERVAIIGIGGLGHLALQYAKATGFHTIAVSHSPDKDRLIRELGADEIVRDGQGLARAGGADVVLGTSNSADAMANSIEGLRPDGRLVVMGVDTKPLPISPLDLVAKRIKLIGSQQNGREYLYEALALAASGKVRTMAETYRFDEIGKAYERVEQGKVRFRAVVTM